MAGSICVDCEAAIDRRSRRCKSCSARKNQRERLERGDYQPIDGIKIVEWKSQRWYLSKDGYYRNREGKLLHRQVYMEKHGPIPPGHEVIVHHENHVRGDFSVDNLLGVSPSEHLAEHGTRGFTAWGPGDPRHTTRVRTMWANRKPIKRSCATCGIEFESIGMRSKYCSRRCSRKNIEKMSCI